ncbi:uncharacterized protein TNCV_4450921 [Trichonephila clavipes]|nr:uncharacterized protein TNCV_4450921 [Trichonephila clavipes]
MLISFVLCHFKGQEEEFLRTGPLHTAMMVAYMKLRDFYGENLTQELRKRTEANDDYTKPFQIRVLCNARDKRTIRTWSELWMPSIYIIDLSERVCDSSVHKSQSSLFTTVFFLMPQPLCPIFICFM